MSNEPNGKGTNIGRNTVDFSIEAQSQRSPNLYIYIKIYTYDFVREHVSLCILTIIVAIHLFIAFPWLHVDICESKRK